MENEMTVICDFRCDNDKIGNVKCNNERQK